MVPIPAPTPTLQALAPPHVQEAAENIDEPNGELPDAPSLFAEAVVVDQDFVFVEYGLNDAAQSIAYQAGVTGSNDPTGLMVADAADESPAIPVWAWPVMASALLSITAFGLYSLYGGTSLLGKIFKR